jgi:hypothetical protein
MKDLKQLKSYSQIKNDVTYLVEWYQYESYLTEQMSIGYDLGKGVIEKINEVFGYDDWLSFDELKDNKSNHKKFLKYCAKQAGDCDDVLVYQLPSPINPSI